MDIWIYEAQRTSNINRVTQIVLKVNDKTFQRSERKEHILFKGIPIMGRFLKRNVSGQERMG